MSGKILAVTFDLWDTVIIDDSDEQKRAEQGLLAKPLERRRLVLEYLNRHEPVTKEEVDLAYNTADAAFRQVWYSQNVTWTVAQRLAVIFKGLGRNLPQADMDELIRLHEDMELEVSPDLAPGIVDAIKTLSGKYRLAVISDAIFSPGRALRELLVKKGLSEYFDAFVFSDEVGCSKPDPRAYKAAAKALDIDMDCIVHIGDRERKDIDGAHNVGAKAIYTTVVTDRGSADTKAEAICNDYALLPGIVEKLNDNR